WLDHPSRKDSILVGVAGLPFKDQAFPIDTQCGKQARRRIGISLAVEDQRPGAAGDYDSRLGIAPGKNGRFDKTIAAGAQFVAAARKVHGSFKAATEHDYPGDALRCRIETREMILQRMQKQRAEGSPG